MFASRGWLRFGGAILLFVLAAAACAPAAPSPTASAVTGGTTPGSIAPTASASAVPTASAVPAASAADQLAAALKPLHIAATFDTIVEVDGATVVSATGRSVGTSSTIKVTTSGRTVEYVRIPPRGWARESGASWVLLGSNPTPAAPLDVLSKPLTLAAGQAGAGSATFDATYPAAALGLTGDPVAVTITVDASGVTFRYETDGIRAHDVVHDDAQARGRRPDRRADPLTLASVP